MIEKVTISENITGHRAARLETWAEYLCLPISYVRERLQDVTARESGIDAQGRKRLHAYYCEDDVASRIPEYAFVQQLRALKKPTDEIRFELCTLLAQNAGYSDKRSLQMESPRTFRTKRIDVFGSSKKFARWILNDIENDYLTNGDLVRIASLLNLPDLSEARKREMREHLKGIGYPDSRSLLLGNLKPFYHQEIGSYGKAQQFFNWVTGENARPSVEDLAKMATILGMPALSQESITELKKALIDAGYVDARSLQYEDPLIFARKKFGRFGKGSRLYAWITGDLEARYDYVPSSERLLHLGQEIGLPKLSEERKMEIRLVLIQSGYPDKCSLQIQSTSNFAAQDFGKFGKGTELYRWVTGNYVSKNQKHSVLRKKQIMEIADGVGIPDFAADDIDSL